MEKRKLLLLGIVLIILLLGWLVYAQFVELGNVKEEQCQELGLSNEEGGNCCFVDDNEEGVLPRYRAVPCDNLDYVPVEEVRYDNVGQPVLQDLNIEIWKG